LGHLEFLMEIGDPVSNQPIGNTRENLTSTQAPAALHSSLRARVG